MMNSASKLHPSATNATLCPNSVALGNCCLLHQNCSGSRGRSQDRCSPRGEHYLVILISSPVGKVPQWDGEACSLSCVKSLGGVRGFHPASSVPRRRRFRRRRAQNGRSLVPAVYGCRSILLRDSPFPLSGPVGLPPRAPLSVNP